MKRLAFILMVCASPAQAGEVVVSIKPLHSLAVSVMEGSGKSPQLLVDGKSSPHDFSLKPSQVKMLHEADVVFYMGEHFEHFLDNLLPQMKARKVPMEHADGMVRYTQRFTGAEKVLAHDMHLWTSAYNARLMVQEMVRVLSKAYPKQAPIFAKNAKALDKKLAMLDAGLKVRMSDLGGKKFAVFHDATQYFEHAYGLSNIGALAWNEQLAGGKHVMELREQITKNNATCVFLEPETDKKVVDNLIEGTGAKTAVLDAEATGLAPGKELYFKLMQSIASAMESCLQ